MAIATSAPDARSLGETLEHHRLETRAQRIQQVLTALEERVQLREAAGFVPPPLLQAIGDFRSQLTELRRRLAVEQR